VAEEAFILTLIAEDSAAAFADVAVSGEVHLVVSVGAHQMASVADSAEIFIQTLEEASEEEEILVHVVPLLVPQVGDLMALVVPVAGMVPWMVLHHHGCKDQVVQDLHSDLQVTLGLLEVATEDLLQTLV